MGSGSASDRTRAILKRLLSGRVLISPGAEIYADFGPDNDSAQLVALSEACPICLVDWQHGEVVHAPRQCKHAYHAHCIAQWLDTQSNSGKKECPCCRLPLDSGDHQQQQQQQQPLEITRLRLPTWNSHELADPMDEDEDNDNINNSNNNINSSNNNSTSNIIWSSIIVDELDAAATVRSNLSEVAVASQTPEGQTSLHRPPRNSHSDTTRMCLTMFRLPDEEQPGLRNRPSFTSDAAVVDADVDVDMPVVVELTDSEDRPSLMERIRPLVDSEPGAPPVSPQHARIRVGHQEWDAIGSRHCPLCRGEYDAASRYTVSQDFACPHLYHEECFLEYACQYLAEHDSNDNQDDDDDDNDDDNDVDDDTRDSMFVIGNLSVQSVPCFCCQRPYLCIPKDIVASTEHNQQQRPRLASF